MHFRTALLASIALTAASALPSQPDANKLCGSKPTGTGPQTPLDEPTVATPEDCKKLCDKDPKCQAFACGTPPNAAAPVCRLYAVAAPEIPRQQDNVVVFAKACTKVPNLAQRELNGQDGNSKPSGNAGDTNHGDPSPTGEPVGPKPTGPNPTGPKPPGPKPTGVKPPGPKPTNAPPKGSKPTGQPVQNDQSSKQEKGLTGRNSCGVKPAGPPGTTPTPIQTPVHLSSPTDCLDLCKKTPNCKS